MCGITCLSALYLTVTYQDGVNLGRKYSSSQQFSKVLKVLIIIIIIIMESIYIALFHIFVLKDL